MKSKNVSLLLSSIVAIAIVGGVAYYFWHAGIQSRVQPSGYQADLKVKRTDISQDEIAKDIQRYQELQAILRKTPNDFWAIAELGMIKKDVGDFEGAEAAWLQLNQQEPGNSISFGNLADLYSNFLKDYNKAIPMYETAIKNSTGEAINASFYRNYFDFYLNYVKDVNRAESVILQGIEDNPKNSELMILAAQFYEDQGNKAKALIYFQKALQLDPQDNTVKQEIERLKKAR